MFVSILSILIHRGQVFTTRRFVTYFSRGSARVVFVYMFIVYIKLTRNVIQNVPTTARELGNVFFNFSFTADLTDQSMGEMEADKMT